jgi:Transcriptional regulators
MGYQIDKVDRTILAELQKNARRPFTDIAKSLGVASGTVHQRINKMTEAGLIVGSKLKVDYQALGFDVTT